MDFLLGTFVTLFAMIDPPGLIPIFMGLTRGQKPKIRQKIALKACLISLTILISFAFIGDFILDKLSISVPSFRIAGGILLLLAAIDMVMGHHAFMGGKSDNGEDNPQRGDVAIFPLAIPLIAGPGSLVSITLMMRELSDDYVLQGGVILVLILVLAGTYLCLRLCELIFKVIGSTGADVLTRVFGILLAALAIQFMVNGVLDLKNLFLSPAEPPHMFIGQHPLFPLK